MHYLYRITDTLNNKVYIGQSNKEDERWRQHKYFARQEEPIQYIHCAMKKYGVENFIYEVIAMCRTQEDADETEEQLIKQYDSCNKENGYNISRGGDVAWNRGLPKEQQPMYGKHHTEESKRKSSISNTGVPHPQRTDEWRNYMSKIMTGRPLTEEWKNKIGAAHKGMKHTEESKIKMSKSLKGMHSGEKHPGATITWEIVRAIRQDYYNGMKQSDIAKKYDVFPATVSQVVNYKNWIE